jgi:hypothetical protein
VERINRYFIISFLFLFFFLLFTKESYAQSKCICIKPDESLFEYTTLDCIDECPVEFDHDWEFIPFGQRPAGWLDPLCVPDYLVYQLKILFLNFPSDIFIRDLISKNLIGFYEPMCPSDIVRRCLLEDLSRCYENTLSGC